MRADSPLTRRSVWPTRALLGCAVFAAIGALLLVALTPLTTVLALSAPVLYPIAAAVPVCCYLAARRWTARAGSASITAVLMGLIALPFTSLGALVLIALAVPAVVVDLVAGARPSRARWHAAAAVAGLVVGILSLTVFDNDVLQPWIIASVLVVRVASFVVAAVVADIVARGLSRAGILGGRRA
ncbi:hypothetical protein [Agromyces atrinae]|uniref:FtsH-binding integral membrane protein n=1 Tax=Agromyces atrinae TaxID=592376 RepID=A0A4Q2MC69_9MICO|nr:hypothetical protein [Agromyces atrinae]NYD68167.1 FtsH-binding integral membrane protein [Agromyces atrinae]RXZ87691.1 hypothetical protein ESP50_00335 [Agromyces atrinae]